METQPDKELERDLQSGAFLNGVDHKRWRLVHHAGVIVDVAVSADPRPGAPDEYCARIDCAGYRKSAPIGVFWDPGLATELADDRWPRLEHDQAFRTDWRPAGPQARRSLYIITDLQTFQHKAAAWLPEHQLEVWQPDVGIACYLEVIYDRLHSRRYLGDSRPVSAA